MDFGSNVGTIVGLGLLALMLVFIIWYIVSMIVEIFNMNAGFHDLQLAYQISAEDRESLSKEEWKKTKRMSYEELTAFLAERFPHSVPEIGECKCDSPKAKTCECD